MNLLTTEKLQHLRAAWQRGLGVRRAASAVGCNRETAGKYYKSWRAEPENLDRKRPMTTNPRFLNLDENGWKIPRHGTLSWEIYELAVMGTESCDIVKELQSRATEGTIRAILSQIKNPLTKTPLK